MLSVKKVSKCFKDKLIINCISFDIEGGEIVSLLGSNGSGKTTTMKLLAGLLLKDKGDILLDDQPLQYKDVGYLPEERSLYYDCTVNQQLDLLASLAKIENKEQLIEYYLKRVNLLDKQDIQISSLSKGNQQKVAMISSLIKPSKILLLDEPFTGLDKDNIHLFESLILEYITQKRIIILSSHIYDPINQYCNRFLLIREGEIVLNKTRNELLQDKRRVIITEKQVDLKNYQQIYKEKDKNKYIFENEELALKAVRYMNNKGFSDYTYRHLQIEDFVGTL